MYSALLPMLASQRAAHMARAAANGRLAPVPASKPPGIIRQRIGWALVHTGLRLVVVRERA